PAHSVSLSHLTRAHGKRIQNSKYLITNSSPLLLPEQSTAAQLPQWSTADVIFNHRPPLTCMNVQSRSHNR
ncbi:hypothetical protein CUMW_132870, partial [Citrus unshiu]